MSRAGVARIVKDHFCPYHYGKRRRLSIRQVFWYLIVPAAVAAFLLFYVGSVDASYQAVFIAVFSIAAAVLTASLGMAQGLVSGMNRTSMRGRARMLVRKRSFLFLEVLRDLYANISYTVTFIVLSLVPLLVLHVVDGDTVVSRLLAAIVYMAAATLAISLFDIVTGIYLVLDENAEETAKSLSGNAGDETNDGG